MTLRLPAALACCGICVAFAQTPPATAFEVTSVKPGKPGARYQPPACANGTYIANGQGVANSIAFAYDVPLFRLAGIPEWVRSRDSLFDIEGKAAMAVSERHCRLMVQALLADRFHLAFHRETRPTPIYALVQGKSKPKLSVANPDSTVNQVKINAAPSFGGDKGWPLSQLADFLGRGFPGMPVLDRTGLDGRYAFSFDFTVEPGRPPGDNMAAAVEQSLGLKLESRKEPIEFIVVDHLDRPAGN
jgi:uncharacterized protein (TIGR03435 family)